VTVNPVFGIRHYCMKRVFEGRAARTSSPCRTGVDVATRSRPDFFWLAEH
jgi:hypothetical protein